MHFFIPIVAAIFYLLGGQVNKWFRWLIGIPIGLLCWQGWTDFGITIGAYFTVANAFSYGTNNWTTKIFGKWVSMALAGLTFGLASIALLGAFWGIIQGIVGMIAFVVLKWLDDTDRLKNPYQELLRGGLGTILYII